MVYCQWARPPGALRKSHQAERSHVSGRRQFDDRLRCTKNIYTPVSKRYRKLLVVGLIDNGYFERTRNPNYLGEVMLYASFAIVTGYWLSWAILFFVWGSLFTANMIIKDYNSLMKKSGWTEYSRRSFIFLPRVSENIFINIVVYGLGITVGLLKYYGYTLPKS